MFTDAGREAFVFKIVCIVTLRRVLCKGLLRGRQLSSCGAIDKEYHHASNLGCPADGCAAETPRLSHRAEEGKTMDDIDGHRSDLPEAEPFEVSAAGSCGSVSASEC